MLWNKKEFLIKKKRCSRIKKSSDKKKRFSQIRFKRELS